MDDRLTRLNEKARALPKAPGVYLMKDDKGRVVYVSPDASGPWAEACLRNADHILMLARPGEPLLRVPVLCHSTR